MSVNNNIKVDNHTLLVSEAIHAHAVKRAGAHQAIQDTTDTRPLHSTDHWHRQQLRLKHSQLHCVRHIHKGNSNRGDSHWLQADVV